MSANSTTWPSTSSSPSVDSIPSGRLERPAASPEAARTKSVCRAGVEPAQLLRVGYSHLGSPMPSRHIRDSAPEGTRTPDQPRTGFCGRRGSRTLKGSSPAAQQAAAVAHRLALPKRKSGRLDLNQRSRASKARDHSGLVHVPSLTTVQVSEAMEQRCVCHSATGPVKIPEGLEPSRPCGHPVYSRIVCMLPPLGTVARAPRGSRTRTSALARQ